MRRYVIVWLMERCFVGDPVIILSCEHGTNHIPKAFAALFKNNSDQLQSHRGYDLGALQFAEILAKKLRSPLFTAATSRLLIDLNRSITHPRLFSEITRTLSATQKKDIIAKYYIPHRRAVQMAIGQQIDAGKTVVHIALHSFTPVFEAEVRDMDIGLLYDPKRESEKRCCRRWKQAMSELKNDLRIRCNAPYQGVSDGLPTYLRRIFPQRYLGIELELNQRFFITHRSVWKKISPIVVDGLQTAFSMINLKHS
jgi:predicted N-formylglutamate amidohydrolase